jgi:hypothetical protein
MANSATRISFIQFLFFAGLGAVVVRAAQLQLFEGARWSKEAARTRTATRALTPRRGTIYDRNGTPLAVSQEFYRVGVATWEVPVRQRGKVAGLLVKDLDFSPVEVKSSFRRAKPKEDYLYRYTPASASDVEELRDIRGNPFTGFRAGIPAYCQYEGRAIYVDSDFIFRADIADLWRQDIPGVLLLRKTDGKLRTCCVVYDCAKAKAHLPGIAQIKAQADPNGAMREYFANHRELLGTFDGDWNCTDLKGYADIADPRIKAIHYTSMPHQPHLKFAVPRLAIQGRQHWYDGELAPHWRPDLVALFDELYVEAQEAGFTADRYDVEPFGTYKKKSWKHYTPKARG